MDVEVAKFGFKQRVGVEIDFSAQGLGWEQGENLKSFEQKVPETVNFRLL